MSVFSLFQIDAFTSQVFGGNPASVMPLSSWLDEHTMQSIAAENSLSETAYFVPEGDGFRLRWFTPTVEMDLCGHATLAAAHVLFEHLSYGGDEDGIDFVSRFFAPHVGINEDPVTGSAHCTLTPYWAAELDKMTMTARQISTRGGILGCELKGERIGLSGNCETFMEGTFSL